ncbi:MAG: threonine/serine exporter family protein [Bacteroidales bacterium]|nr:threonine/serine exporter family protein [Bacteroidales bacterium]
MEENALDVAALAGHILLENGAEISRVEETMERIATHYGVESTNFFVLSNGIFTSGSAGYAKVDFIPFKGAQLERVVAVNQLSREIAEDKYTLEEAEKKLQAIRKMRPKPKWEQTLGSAIGAAGFCVIFGGGLLDAAAAFVAGTLLWLFVAYVSAPYLTKTIGNLLGGFLTTIVCMAFHQIGFGSSLGNMIIGALIPLIPGVAFTNGIRDIADEDYIAGFARLLDAMMILFCIAAGVILAFGLDYLLEGQMLIVNGTEPDPITASFPFQILAAIAGTFGFSILFGVPRKNYLQATLVGTIGWIVYLLFFNYTVFGIIGSTFAATVVLAVLARIFAIIFKTPETVFLITGLFPLAPGGGIFWATFFLVSRRFQMASHSGMTALGITAAIVIGVVLVNSLPKTLFHRKR